MKAKNIAVGLAVLSLAAALAACGTPNSDKDNVQALNYEESTAAIADPDQGFYLPLYVKIDADGISYNKAIVTDATRLYHLRCDISAFSAAVNGKEDIPLTPAATDGLDELLSLLKKNDKNAIVRFAYDPGYNGKADKEPSLDVMRQHVAQVCAVLNKYGSTVTAIETGLIGPWGEMHTSAAANTAHISSLIDAFLTNTSDIPVSVRTPKMIYDYLGITADKIRDHVIAPTVKAYRLGLYNDGYLGSESDLGTYSDRRRDIEFLSRQTAHLPFGGEVVVPDSPLHDIETCLPEMFEINLSYLNSAWNNAVIDKWKTTYYTKACGADSRYYGKTAYEYIENRLGYRFVLKRSVISFPAPDALDIALKLQNVGFGNLNKTKHSELIFTNASGGVAYSQAADDFTGEVELHYNVAPELESGKYDVYLRLYGDEMQGTPLYCIRFANDGLWNETLKANKIGSIEYSADKE